MNFSLRPPGGDRTWNAALVFLGGAYMIYGGARKPIVPLLVVGSLLLISGAGLWCRQSWARWSAAACLVSLAAFMGWRLATGHFGWITLLSVLVMAWFAWRIVVEGKEEKPDENDKPLTSFVLLLDGPRRLSARDLADKASRAWGGDYGATDKEGGDGKEGTRWVVGDSPLFLLKSDEALFMIHNFPVPYSQDAKKTAQTVQDLRLRRAIEDHRAWLAVDLMRPFDSARSEESFYPAIARLIAELGGDDCRAIFHPESGRINAWDATLPDKLRGPEPLKDFARPANPPVVAVEDDDPSMMAAVAEARRRLPEFVQAFRRKEGDHFAVKAPLTAGGRTEHLWIEVQEIGPDTIDGVLGNEPVGLGGMKLGDRVEVAPSDVEDWVIVRDGSPVGLFSAKSVDAARKRPRT